jgi:hypothetical protein
MNAAHELYQRFLKPGHLSMGHFPATRRRRIRKRHVTSNLDCRLLYRWTPTTYWDLAGVATIRWGRCWSPPTGPPKRESQLSELTGNEVVSPLEKDVSLSNCSQFGAPNHLLNCWHHGGSSGRSEYANSGSMPRRCLEIPRNDERRGGS